MTETNRDVAITTAFLYAGALQELRDNRKNLCLDIWNGHTGFAESCAQYAHSIEKWLATREGDNYPGVYAYEIIEPLGAWAVNEAAQPDTAAVLAEFQKRFLAWIKDTDEYGIKPTDRVLDAHGNVIQEGSKPADLTRTIETKHYTIWLDINGVKSQGYFEHKIHGDERAGGLWYDEKKDLRDYDGVAKLPKEVREALKADGFTSTEGCFD
jgi:hypothetical protein